MKTAEVLENISHCSAAGLGLRSKRYSMIVQDGEVVKENVEKTPGEYVNEFATQSHLLFRFTVTGAQDILKVLEAK